jgi:hypothetical protein
MTAADDLTKEHAREVLRANNAQLDKEAARIAELESQGFRIVDGGQKSGWYERDGQQVCQCVTTDWRTGEVLLEIEVTSVDEFDAAANAIKGSERWWHIDVIFDNDDDHLPHDVTTPGLPPSLQGAIRDWVTEPSTPDEEVADWVGWPVEQVKKCLIR